MPFADCKLSLHAHIHMSNSCLCELYEKGTGLTRVHNYVCIYCLYVIAIALFYLFCSSMLSITNHSHDIDRLVTHAQLHNHHYIILYSTTYK